LRAEDLQMNGVYAYVDPDFPNDPMKAHAMSEADDGTIDLAIVHPDEGVYQVTVATRTLVGEWDAPLTAERWQAAVEEVKAAGQEPTWESVAKARHELVRRQRDLADRLAKVSGVERGRQSYAGRGGTAKNVRDVNLQLNYDELDGLLTAVEKAPQVGPQLPRPVTPMEAPMVVPVRGRTP
jgi:hypothetical protein